MSATLLDAVAIPLRVDPCAVYLVGVVPADAHTHIDGVGFEPDHHARILRLGSLSAIVIELPLSYFAGADAETRLGDVAWLSPRAARHEALLQQAMASSAVMPARFGTVFSTRERLEHALDAHAPGILAFLERTRHAQEWHIRVLVDRQRALDALSADLLRSAAGAAPGARYLLEKRLKQQAAQTLAASIDQTAAAIVTDLRAICQDVRERPGRAHRAQGTETVASIACLLPQDALPAFHARALDLQREFEPSGLTIDASGPWPPYSFCPALGATT